MDAVSSVPMIEPRSTPRLPWLSPLVCRVTFAALLAFGIVNRHNRVVAMVDNEVTLKRFYKRRDHIFLQSATASTDPIRLFPSRRNDMADCDTVKVQGVVTMVLKAQ